MDDKLYNLMNWREIEGITYSDTDKPHELLGQHIVKDGILIQAYVPDAIKLQIKNLSNNKLIDMDMADEAGFFAALLPGRKKINYKLSATYGDNSTYEFYDAYAFDNTIPETVLRKFNAGIAYDIYKYLGAHCEEVDGVKGVRFAVWAPFALRVSVVGEFNNWDGRRHQMTRRMETGVFEIFIPEVNENMMYKYEIKRKGDVTSTKLDPYAYCLEKLPGEASIVRDINSFTWTDEKWLDSRKTKNTQKSPLNIYEIKVVGLDMDKVTAITTYVKDMKYTHVKLLDVIDSTASPRAYFAPDSDVADSNLIMALVDSLHAAGVGVIMDIPMHHFSVEEEGLAVYDGTCLYEHENIKKGYCPEHNTKLFNYGRPEVSNYLISSALFWTFVYHMDGINITKAAAMIYLDYDKKDGEWLPNIYGGNENLEAIELLKHLNSIYRKLSGGAIMIAEDNSGYQNMTGEEVTSECIGFDFKYNEGWRRDLLDFIKYEPYVRHQYYNDLTLNYVYTFNDSYILPLTHELSDEGQPALMGRMVGDSEENKYSNLKLMLGYYMTYPGKKMLFMENDMASYEALKSFNTEILNEEAHRNINECVKALNAVYASETALYENDNSEDGFEWINNISATESIIIYDRKGDKPDDVIVVICNFDNVDRDDYKIGVPFAGKYKEIFNTDNTKFGGKGFTNPRLKQSKTDECDGRTESIRIKVAALSMAIFKYSKEDKKVSDNKSAKTTAAKAAKAVKAIAEEKSTIAKQPAKKQSTKQTPKSTTVKKTSVAVKGKGTK